MVWKHTPDNNALRIFINDVTMDMNLPNMAIVKIGAAYNQQVGSLSDCKIFMNTRYMIVFTRTSSNMKMTLHNLDVASITDVNAMQIIINDAPLDEPNILFSNNDMMINRTKTMNVTLLSVLIGVAGILGNMVGYWFGFKSGYYLYKKEDSFWFKKKYLIQSKDFFEKYGGKAIIFARFLPIFRTFAPIVAGIVTMYKKKFMFYNIVSSFLWSFILIFSGHYLYGLFLEKYDIDLKHHIEKIVIGIILISTLPVFFKMIKKTPKTDKLD